MSNTLRQQAEDSKILEIIAGSHLYGTSTPESDKDFVGVFMPPSEYVLGLQSVQEVDFNVVAKGEDGKNTKKAVDRKLYEFRKFINLATKNNPNIIEILFATPKTTIFTNDIGRELLSIRMQFPSQQCIPRFIGYANSQRHKMIIRRDNFNDLRNGYGFLLLCNPKTTMGQVYDYMKDCDPKARTFWRKDTGMHVHCGDICFEPGVYAKKAAKMLKNRLDKVTNRSELVLKYGFDTKFGSHLIRLLYEGLELLNTGMLSFPLEKADIIKDIKKGKWEAGKVIEHANELEKEYELAELKTKLPKRSNYKLIEKFTIKMMSKHLNLA